MDTPTDPRRARDLASRGTPAQAVARAWTDPGPRPDWHRAAQDEVRRAMPTLAAALDRLAEEAP